MEFSYGTRSRGSKRELRMILRWAEGQKEATKVENKQHKTKLKKQTKEGESQDILNGGWFYQ